MDTITNDFKKIEEDIMMVLTGEPENLFSQYDIYRLLLDKYELKDPNEKNNLKYNFLIVLRRLSTLYNCLNVFNKEGVLYAKFTFEEETISANIEIPKLTSTVDMPNERAVIEFIVDNNLDSFLDKKDYDGNSIMHKIAEYGDIERFKKVYSKKETSMLIFLLNNKNETPIDIISDIRLLNYIVKDTLSINKNNQEIMVKMDSDIALLYLRLKFVIQFIFLIIVYIIYINTYG